MEIYNFYEIVKSSAFFFIKDETFLPLMPLIGIIGGVILWAVLFILQGFGLYKMAKNRGIKYKALAFVPFVNIWYIGKLAGDCYFFGQKVKRAGMYAMIAQIVATLFMFATIAAEVYLWIRHGVPTMETELGVPYWEGLMGFDKAVYGFFDISIYLLSIFQLIYEIFLVILVMALYKKYEPKNYMILSMLTLFVPMSRSIIIFVFRNRKAIDFEAYMRARREAYIRRQQQYYNQYNNPYNRYGQNPYGQNPYGQSGGQNPSQADDPFSEFSSKSKGEKPFEEYDNSDGFFD